MASICAYQSNWPFHEVPLLNIAIRHTTRIRVGTVRQGKERLGTVRYGKVRSGEVRKNKAKVG